MHCYLISSSGLSVYSWYFSQSESFFSECGKPNNKASPIGFDYWIYHHLGWKITPKWLANGMVFSAFAPQRSGKIHIFPINWLVSKYSMGELIIPTKPLRLLTPKSMNHQRYQRYPHSFHALNPIKKQKNMKPLTLLSSWLISSTTCQAHSIKDKSHIQEEAKTSKCRGENLKKSAELVSGLFLQWIYIYIFVYT